MARGKGKIKRNAEAIVHFRGLIVTGICSLAFVAIGCSSGDSANSNTLAVNSRTVGNNSNVTNAGLNPKSFGNTEASNSNANVRPMDEAMQKIERIRAAANREGKAIPSLNSRPAQEDSTISSTLTDVARETRIWKKHPVLAKVEKIYDGGEGSIKVYLRNGKVIDLPGKSITQLDQISAESVLAIAGVASPKVTNDVNSSGKPKRRN